MRTYNDMPQIPWILLRSLFSCFFVASELIYESQMLSMRLTFVKNFLSLTAKMIKKTKRYFMMLQKMLILILTDLRSKAEMR